MEYDKEENRRVMDARQDHLFFYNFILDGRVLNSGYLWEGWTRARARARAKARARARARDT